MDSKTHIYNPQEENRKLRDEICALRHEISNLIKSIHKWQNKGLVDIDLSHWDENGMPNKEKE